MQNNDRSITLYCQQGSADKEYRVTLSAVDGGFMVAGYNGRRGAALKCQPKTASPVTFAEADAIFNDLVKSKVKGGYTPAEVPGSSFMPIADMGEASGIELQLLLAQSEDDIERYLSDDTYLAQIKEDGERRTVCHAASGEVFGSNRSGLKVPLPQAVAQQMSAYPAGTTIDGELIGDQLVAFDLLENAGRSLANVGCEARYRDLNALLAVSGNALRLVQSAVGTDAKRALYAKLRDIRAEGIVFKKRNAGLTVGRCDDQVKIKFVERATVQVSAAHPSKRSVSVQAFDTFGVATPLGNVTIPANHAIPAVGEIVEIQYLYVVSSLYQPVYLGPRTDLNIAACTLAQLKYKGDKEVIAASSNPAANDVQHALFA